MAKKPEITTPADQPYYLQRAHIKDFRTIRDAVVEFKPGLNIIIGANGSGKTNFVSGVAEALSFSTQIIEYFPSAEFVLAGRNRIELSCNRQQPKASTNIRFSNFFVEHTTEVKVTTKNSQSIGSSLAEAISSNQDLLQEYIFFEPVLIKYNVPIYYSITADLIISSSNNNDFSMEVGLSKTISRILTGNIISTEGESHDFNRDAIVKTIVNALGFYIENFKPYVKKYSPVENIRLSKSIQVNKNSMQEKINVRGINLEFCINNDWLLFEDLSSGTQRILYIIFESLQPPDYSLEKNNTSDYASTDDRIILLEEPELGIHPDQLHLLLNFLREQSKKHQLIITTHSPQVLDMLNDDELDRITICELHKTKGTQFRKLKKTQIAAAKQYMSTQGLYLSDYWRYGSLESTK